MEEKLSFDGKIIHGLETERNKPKTLIEAAEAVVCDPYFKNHYYQVIHDLKEILDRKEQVDMFLEQRVSLLEQKISSMEVGTVEADNSALKDKCDNLQEDAKRLRMQLAACTLAALANTESSKKKRLQKDDPNYSATYADVCRAVDMEILYRTALEDILNLGGMNGADFVKRAISIAKSVVDFGRYGCEK